MTRSPSNRVCLFVSVVVMLLLGATRAAAAQDYIWLEAENPDSTNIEDYWTGADRAHLLSADKLLAQRYQGEAVRNAPEGGYRLQYTMKVPRAGAYDAWARVGMESIRAPFEWRIGDGEWTLAPASKWTTNVMELARYNEIAWLDLGEVQIDEGTTTLTIRYTKPQEGRNDLFIMLDCFAFVPAARDWSPEGDLKPGETYDSEQDTAAASKVYDMPEPAGEGARRSVKLTGLWQVARWDDPDMDKDAWEPETELPDLGRLYWRGIDIPKSQWEVDGLNLAHRTVYRTRVNIPEGYEGRGFKLHFSGTNWLVGVFVNGELAGTHKGVWIPWDIDISNQVKPGQVNEIALAIKGPWYAIDVEHYKGPPLMAQRNRPLENVSGVHWVAPIYPSTKGDGDGRQYGIVNPVTLEATGNAYTEDVFVQPEGETNRPDSNFLTVDVTVRNTHDTARTFQVKCEAVFEGTGEVERELGPVEVKVPAHKTLTKKLETRDWRGAKLWWPEPNPNLYTLRTTISEDGRVLDVHDQLFGYRWIDVHDRGMYLNSYRFNTWNWVGVSGRPQTAEEWLERFRGENNRFTRFSQNRKTSTFLRTREERLDFYDRNGIPGRLCSMIDGMFGSFHFGEKRVNATTGERFIEPNEPVWEGWKRHIRQMTRAYRNHPSVLVYQVENELIYINGMNRGYPQDAMEDLMGDVIDAGRVIDATRPYTVGGAGDLDCECEINAPHYPLGDHDWYPENAYTLEKIKDKLHMYPPFYHNKPWTVGESLHANHLAFSSLAVGDEAFRSATNAAAGKARFLRDVYEGYRYGGAAGFYPWDNLSQFEDSLKMFSALAVIPRKRTYRVYGGRSNELLFKIMNDTLKDRPVLFEWTYEAGDQVVAQGREEMRIDPGFGQERMLNIDAPETDVRLEGKLTVKLTQPGVDSTADYVDVRSIPVLPAVQTLDIDGPVYVMDPSGRVAAFLKAAGQAFEAIDDLSATAGKNGLLIVGPNALTVSQAFGRDLLKFAAQGGRAVVLEQQNPVAGSNLPAPIVTTTHYGGYAHPQALGTPVFRDLGEDDLIDWAGDHPTFVNSYQKPAQGGRSLVESGAWLERTPLVEMPTGEGVIVLCQLRVGAKLGVDPAADVLLRNMAEHYAGYRPAAGIAAIYAPDDRLLADSIGRTGIRAARVDSAVAALDAGRFKVAVIHATEKNLQALNDAADRVKAFQEAGGWVMLCGLDREGIEEFSSLIGSAHQIRPFRMERITLEQPNYALAATLGNRDLAMYSPKHLQHSKDWISWNVYSAVVDAHPNVAPFTIPPEASEEDLWNYKQTWNDKDPYNYVNNLLVSDHWRYIRQIWLDAEQDNWPFVFEFRRPETISKVRIWNNDTYGAIENVSIIFDNDEAGAVRTVLPAADQLTEVELETPRRVEKSITLRVDSYREGIRKFEGGHLVGINNVQFIRPEDDAPGAPVSIDNIGGLVAYPRGNGGFFLNQVKFMEEEPLPINADKKLNLMGTVLRNMGVGSGTSVVPIAGVNIRYEPVSLLDHCNQFLANTQTGPGWFGQSGHDMSLLPKGERRLKDDVLYHIVDYATAPVPDCIVMGVRNAPEGLSKKVEGIDVGKKGDMLFFLHTAHVQQPVSPEQRSNIGAEKNAFKLPEILRYVVHYEDGESVEIPVILEKDIDHWLAQEPKPLPHAQVAATVQVPGLEDLDQNRIQWMVYQMNARRGLDLPFLDPKDVRGVLYGMQVKNPRPDVTIKSIDVLPGANERTAIPAVLGITLGTIIE